MDGRKDTNNAFITCELALVTLIWTFATVVSTAVLALVTLVWTFATVERSRFEWLTFGK